MARALRLEPLNAPPAPPAPPLRHQRTGAPSPGPDCALNTSGHHSHWIPMRHATQDPVGVYGTVVRLHDAGLDVLTDDGRVLPLRHHDMAGHGDALAADRRVFVQLRWGWLWTDALGISVTDEAGWRPCEPPLSGRTGT
jgi:hypothetical protein